MKIRGALALPKGPLCSGVCAMDYNQAVQKATKLVENQAAAEGVGRAISSFVTDVVVVSVI